MAVNHAMYCGRLCTIGVDVDQCSTTESAAVPFLVPFGLANSLVLC